ncbi:MAG: vWA domain-containing protein, partial [Planctomycetota bacterium]
MTSLWLLAEASTLRWKSLPPAWVIALVILPLAVLLVTLAYRPERLDRRRRLFLGVVRAAALMAAVLLLFGPFFERTIKRKVRSHMLVLVDTSASMDVADDVDPTIAGDLSDATGVPRDSLGSTPRLELARRALLHGGEDSPIEKMRGKFITHVYSFSDEPRIAWSGDSSDETMEDGSALADARTALGALKPDGSTTRLGDSVLSALEDFRLRNEPVAAVVVLSDGRQTAGARTPREAGEAALQFLQTGSMADRGVPVISIVAGDPSSSRNVQVRNLVAPEVVLARDDASFEFDVVQKGFDGQRGVLRLMFVEPRGENAVLDPGEVTLRPGEAGTRVKARSRFERPGNYLVRVGVPPLAGERIASDNWIEHHIRVVDRKVKVLYVDGRPRREWESLQRALTRD